MMTVGQDWSWHGKINATIGRSLLFSFFLIASSAIAVPAFSDGKKVLSGFTMSQIRSPQGTRCLEKTESARTRPVLPRLRIEMLHQE
jgi:hypothetical protein